MSLPEINFVDTDTATIENAIITGYEAVSGRTLAQGDPVRLFLLSVASIIVQQRTLINYTGKMNLLAYAVDDYLDHIGLLVGTARLQATAAKTVMKITLSEERAVDTMIPARTRITAGDEVFFATVEDVIIPAGETEILSEAYCTEEGTRGNEYLPGQIKTIVDPIPFVQSIINTTTSAGGSAVEDDKPFRARIQQAPESFSVAGPDGAYRYWAKSASSRIVDVSVHSSEPGKIEVYILLENGALPGSEILDLVRSVLNDTKIRPLGDLVSIFAPEVIAYDVLVDYYIDSENQATASSLQRAIEQAIQNYILWQKSKLGRDINPSELVRLMVNAGAKRANVISPVYKNLNKKQVGIAAGIKITYGGVEDD